MQQTTSPPVGPQATPTGMVYVQPMPPQMMTTTAAAASTLNSYPARQSVGLGAAQIALGCLCFVFNGVALGVSTYYYEFNVGAIGHGFWSGAFFIVAGSIGIAAGMRKTKCKIISYMVMCILAACCTAVLLSFGIIGASVGGYGYGYGCHGDYDSDYYYYGYDYRYSYYYRPPCSNYRMLAAMEGCMAVTAFIAAVLLIWGAALCCRARPCCQPPTTSAFSIAVPAAGYATPNGQMMQAPVVYQWPTMPYQPGLVLTPPAYQPTGTFPQWNYQAAAPPPAAAAAVPASSSTIYSTAAAADNSGYIADDPPKY